MLLSIMVFILGIFDLTLGVEYVVGPVNRRDKLACERTGEMLEKACPGKVRAYVSEIRQVTQLWLIDIDPGEVRKIGSIPGVNLNSPSWPRFHSR